ncbi:Uncharacterized protein AXF42_Ash014800 [Apostasia shenzhenica]|uniref:Hydroxyproline-rich glycoprotein family protein n=1 Tax=Apostasia shenzhenica TaxID=1088818 RepID=A0A2H9ZWF1_9ASPA|nr:Uncharacterized protein AXF42_Ash014800 [Apostasia shenzhenica]
MRSSMRKLRGLGLHRSEKRERREHLPPAKLDDLVQAAQDMQDMKSCYDGLLSAAAATANSAYEFSEALDEMGTCLLEKIALRADEDNGRVLLMLGKAQFELQKLVDNYVSSINAIESLLGELQIVEVCFLNQFFMYCAVLDLLLQASSSEMKHHCDEKRDLYKFMLAMPRMKGSSGNAKGETFTIQQLQAAQEDYEEETNLFVFRLKSLKQGQSRSLLTQAVRHHAAQVRGVKSLELIEPHVKAIAEQQHIDYHFRGLEDDYTDFNYDSGCFTCDSSDDGELSFDYELNEQIDNILPTGKSSGFIHVGDKKTKASSLELLQEDIAKHTSESLFHNQRPNRASQSAPILADRKFDLSMNAKETTSPSARKYHTYALPTPFEVQKSATSNRNIQFSSFQHRKEDISPSELGHSFPLEAHKLLEPYIPVDSRDKSSPSPIKLPKDQLGLKESSSFPAPEAKKIKRQAFSGPLIGKSWSTVGFKPQNMVSTGFSKLKYNVLHELPRPPTSLANPVVSSSLVVHSAPLASTTQEIRTTGKAFPVGSQMPSPLPAPPAFAPQGFSTTYRDQITADSPPATPKSLK